MDTVNNWLTAIEAFFTYRHAVSIALGLLVGMGLSQLLKFPIAALTFDNNLKPTQEEVQIFRWNVRLVGFVAGAVATYFSWPNGDALIFGFAVGGLVAPLYWALGPLQRRFAPWLSATREPPDPTDEQSGV